ncbi:MAG: hypothetical protein GQE15_07455, partial [Archangiaceae bacterium]|nr:hypothetical protein [Archangiaceae bacterium]
MSWIVMAMLAAAPTTIAIDGSTACAPRQVLERELRRAPVQFVEGAAALIVRLAPEGASHRLLVRDASGAIVIERVLPTAACQEAGVAAALIIDRALRDIVVRLPPSVTRDATAKDATKNDATKNDATKNDAAKN